jgi:hypothetical protein
VSAWAALHPGLQRFDFTAGTILARNELRAREAAMRAGWVPAVWVSVTSHRARAKLAALAGPLGPGYGRWPDGGQCAGEYFPVRAELSDSVGKVKGLRVLRAEPASLFRRIDSREE